MITILVDHDMEGQAALLWETLQSGGWTQLLPLRFVTLADVGLTLDSTDREVWRFSQAHQVILLTNNRSMKDESSLERTLREDGTDASLPVLTVGSVRRLEERPYREACATRLIEILVDLDRYLGIRRLYIP